MLTIAVGLVEKLQDSRIWELHIIEINTSTMLPTNCFMLAMLPGHFNCRGNRKLKFECEGREVNVDIPANGLCFQCQEKNLQI